MKREGRKEAKKENVWKEGCKEERIEARREGSKQASKQRSDEAKRKEDPGSVRQAPSFRQDLQPPAALPISAKSSVGKGKPSDEGGPLQHPEPVPSPEVTGWGGVGWGQRLPAQHGARGGAHVCLSVHPPIRPSLVGCPCRSVCPSIGLSYCLPPVCASLSLISQSGSPPVSPSVCPTVCPSVCLSVPVSLCWSISLPVRLSRRSPVCLPMWLSARLSICLSVCPSVRWLVSMPICLSD